VVEYFSRIFFWRHRFYCHMSLFFVLETMVQQFLTPMRHCVVSFKFKDITVDCFKTYLFTPVILLVEIKSHQGTLYVTT